MGDRAGLGDTGRPLSHRLAGPTCQVLSLSSLRCLTPGASKRSGRGVIAALGPGCRAQQGCSPLGSLCAVGWGGLSPPSPLRSSVWWLMPALAGTSVGLAHLHVAPVLPRLLPAWWLVPKGKRAPQEPGCADHLLWARPALGVGTHSYLLVEETRR